MQRFPLMPVFAAAAALTLLVACYPAFNWREVRPEGTALSLLLPCKPDQAKKTVLLGGKPTELTLLGCDAGDITFAVAVARLGSAQEVTPALAQWQSAMLANMKAGPIGADVGTDAGAGTLVAPLKLPGAAVQPSALLVRAKGQRADGKAVSGHAAYFAQGSQVFQAVMYADKIPPEVAETFFSSLKLE
ncbi:MAG: hypothetical protein H7228_13505 [Polaromonas sp.]|nr:hypothetical protein [Polaromonas sp.]